MKERNSYSKQSGAEEEDFPSDPSYEDDQNISDVEWDGSEVELVSEEEEEKYEENRTGVKIKYTLSESEISEFFRHTEGYKKNSRLQKNHTIIQTVIFLVLILLWVYMGSIYYAFLTIFPVLSVIVIWTIPILSRKKLAKKFCSGEEISAEIFPDKITMKIKDSEKEVLFDGACECEEVAGIILIYPKDAETIMIPMRAIEPEFLPDVQAMIFAGAQPRYEN